MVVTRKPMSRLFFPGAGFCSLLSYFAPFYSVIDVQSSCSLTRLTQMWKHPQGLIHSRFACRKKHPKTSLEVLINGTQAK